MLLDELIYSKVASFSDLVNKLALFNNGPAIFRNQAPDDEDEGWTGDQYPRIDFIIDFQEDPERRIQGNMTFNVWCTISASTDPDELERDLRNLLDGSVFHPTDTPVTAIQWRQSDPFETRRARLQDNLIIGVTISFDLLSFPSQETYSPDPVQGLNAWSAKFTEVQVDPTSWNPSDTNPALYWRLAGVTAVERTNWGAWVNANVSGHVLAPSTSPRLKWIRSLVESASIDKTMKLDDSSYLTVQKVAADSSQDPFRVGQIKISVRFGVLNTEPAYDKLNNANISGGVI